MVNLTLSVAKELKDWMDEFPEINWSEVARQAFRDKIEDMRFLNKLKSKSKMTEEDAIELGREVNKALSKKYTRGD